MYNRLFQPNQTNYEPLYAVTGIAADVWKKIIENLDAIDAVSLVRVCKDLFKLLHDHNPTWVNNMNGYVYTFTRMKELRSDLNNSYGDFKVKQRQYQQFNRDDERIPGIKLPIPGLATFLWTFLSIVIIWDALTSRVLPPSSNGIAVNTLYTLFKIAIVRAATQLFEFCEGIFLHAHNNNLWKEMHVAQLSYEHLHDEYKNFRFLKPKVDDHKSSNTEQLKLKHS